MNTEYFVTVDLKSSGQGIFVAGATLSQQQVVATTFMTGPTGKAATIEIGSTTTVAPNQPATVTNTGDEHHTILEFEIPKGDKGDKGDDATNPVESVNGQTGEVTLDYTDVGADEAGSAATAEANANAYTDTETAAAILESKGYTDDELQALATAIGAQLAAKADLVGGLVPSSQLPAYVDDVLSYPDLAAFPATGESGKIYVTEDTNLTYRWSGSAYVEISASLALGETSSTAFAGNRGKAVEDALLNKVDKTASASRIYATGSGGGDVTLPWSYSSTPDAIPRLGAGGVLNVGNPTGGNHATTKTYVDAADALKVSKAGDTMTGRLSSTNPSAVGYDQTRGGFITTWGTSASGRFVATSPNGLVGLSLSNSGLRIGDDSAIAVQALDVAGNARINGADYLVGTGMPNGVVSAPVGSIYIDKNATNGASSWIKKSGTGNTGWQVLEGDTGWRNVSSDFSGLFDVVSPLDYGVYWRRVRQVGYFKMRSSVTDVAVTSKGFGTSMAADGQGYTVRSFVQGSTTKVMDLVFQGSSLFTANGAAVNGDRLGFTLAYGLSASNLTSWPTTLPGIAV